MQHMVLINTVVEVTILILGGNFKMNTRCSIFSDVAKMPSAVFVIGRRRHNIF